jgi:hypothetical protein
MAAKYAADTKAELITRRFMFAHSNADALLAY